MLLVSSPIIAPLLEDSLDVVPPISSRSSFFLRRLNEPTRETQINPSIVVIVVILTIIFFLSGCLHLLIRCIARSPRRDPNGIVTLTALQGQLQQLFHLHDSGVEQAFIDTLPVFLYKSVKGLKEGADCAVCLCEFQAEDRLRLLPKCSHAFHLDCIDTWLLSHSTCPLCRRSLLPDGLNLPPFAQGLLLESSRSSAVDEAEVVQGNARSDARVASGFNGEADHPRQGTQGVEGPAVVDPQLHHSVLQKQDGGIVPEATATTQEDDPSQGAGRIVSVQLGRFRIVEGDNAATSSINGSRRSYSVGSYEYVLDPSNLEVVIAPTPYRRRTSTPRRPVPGHRTTLSECTPEDVLPDPIVTPFGEGFFEGRSSPFTKRRQELTDSPDGLVETGDNCWVTVDLGSVTTGDADASAVAPMGEHITTGASALSYMAKQAILYGPRIPHEEASSSRRAVSFRQPISESDAKLKVSASRRSLSETEVSGWDDEERSFSGLQLMSRSNQNSNTALERGVPSLAKRTINWLVGKQKRIVHSAGGVMPGGAQR